MSHMTLSKYVKVGGEINETPFQAFEIPNVIMALFSKGPKKPELSMTSWKEVKTVVEVGHSEGWGRVLELPTVISRFWS